MNGFARPFLLAVLATSLLAFATPPAAAQPERPTDAIAALHITVTSAQLEDLALYAASTGRTVDSVVAQFAGSDRFAALVDEVRSRYPSELVFAQWEVGSGTLIVRPGGAASVEPLRAATSVAITVLERDVPNEEEQLALSERVGESLRGSGVAVGTWFDVDGNRVVVDVPSSSGKRVVEAQLSATLPLKWGGKDVPVDVVVRSDRSWTPATAHGGKSYGGCTGGFIVVGSGVRGISTAGHCASIPSSYDGNLLGISTRLADRDVRWTKFSSGTSDNQFQYDFGGYRSASSSGNPVVGDVACKFGLTTGRFCTTIQQSGYNGGGYGYYNQYVTAAGSVQGGDSGGPWYYGNRALGITSGWLFVTDPTKPTNDCFTGVGSLNLLGVVVVVG